MQEVKERKTKTPRNADSILSGALKLSLQERVRIAKAISNSITEEVQLKKTEAEEAAKIAGG